MQMELTESITTSGMKRRAKGTISLDEYLFFTQVRNHHEFSVNHLNQILFMNGFKKLHHLPKICLIEALDSIELMDPARSTLKEEISPCTFITLEEVIKDLAELDWQECCVTSIQTLVSSKVSETALTKPAGSASKRRRSNKRPKSSEKLLSLPGSVHASCASPEVGNGNLKRMKERSIVDILKH